MMSSNSSSNSEKTLIICIDRDNDIGNKTGIPTPIVGRDRCVDAATKLALADPEEADANAIFAGVREYDHILSSGRICEVAVVGGLFERGTQADRKLRSEVAEVVRGFNGTEAVVISDGIEGEEVVPIIQSLVPVVSVHKVIVKHSKSVEESYAVFARYLRMLIFDSRYARYALGLPGIIFVGLVAISLLDPQIAPEVLLGLIGAVFIIRGFDIDKKLESIRTLSATGYLRLFASIVSVLIIVAGLATGFAAFYPSSTGVQCLQCINIQKELAKDPGSFFIYGPTAAGYFIQYSELLVWLGLGVYIVGTLFFDILRPKPRHVISDTVALIVLGLLYFPVSYIGAILESSVPVTLTDEFVAIVLFALAVNFTIAAYVYQRFSRRRHSQATPQTVEV
jgi:putative membrane protein